MAFRFLPQSLDAVLALKLKLYVLEGKLVGDMCCAAAVGFMYFSGDGNETLRFEQDRNVINQTNIHESPAVPSSCSLFPDFLCSLRVLGGMA